MQRNAISVTYLVMKRFSPFFYSLVLIVLFFNGIVSPDHLPASHDSLGVFSRNTSNQLMM